MTCPGSGQPPNPPPTMGQMTARCPVCRQAVYVRRGDNNRFVLATHTPTLALRRAATGR